MKKRKLNKFILMSSLLFMTSCDTPVGKYQGTHTEFNKTVTVTLELKITNKCTYIVKYMYDSEEEESFYYPVCTWERKDRRNTLRDYDLFIIRLRNDEIDFKRQLDYYYIDSNLHSIGDGEILYKV